MNFLHIAFGSAKDLILPAHMVRSFLFFLILPFAPVLVNRAKPGISVVSISRKSSRRGDPCGRPAEKPSLFASDSGEFVIAYCAGDRKGRPYAMAIPEPKTITQHGKYI